MPLSEILHLLTGDRVCFSECGHCQEKPTLPHGPNWEITRERWERKKPSWSCTVSYRHNFKIALLKDPSCWVHPWQKEKHLLVETFAFACWHAWMGTSGGLLRFVICGLLCSTTHLQLLVLPGASCTHRQLPKRCSATFQLAVCHPAWCAMLPGLECFADTFQTLFPFFTLL